MITKTASFGWLANGKLVLYGRNLVRQEPFDCFMHHPPNWLVPEEHPHLWRDLAREFSFLLHGHEHQTWGASR